MRAPLVVAILWTIAQAAPCARGQSLLPNSGFEEGGDTPLGWRLTGGDGRWSESTAARGRFVTVEGRGDGQSVWQTAGLRLEPAGLYRLRFLARREGGGGTAVAGTGRVNRDFRLDDAWREESYVFAVPSGSGGSDHVRLGQWHLNGRVSFDEARLVPVVALHRGFGGGVELGEAESIRGGIYRFQPAYGWVGANVHRPLWINQAGFNSDRWVFSPGAEVVYRLGAAGCVQQSARLRVAIHYHTAGSLRVEASRDGSSWQTLTSYDGQRRGGVVELPAGLFPATEMFVRLVEEGAEGGFQVNTLDYEARLATTAVEGEGETYFLEAEERARAVAVEWRSLRRADREGQWQLDFVLTNLTSSPLGLRGWVGLDVGMPPEAAGRTSLRLDRSGRLGLACPFGEAGPHVIRVLIEDDTGRAVFAGRVEVRVGFLDDRRPGYWLAAVGDVGVWWCESGWKIGRERGLPEKRADGRPQPLSVWAARGEYEAAQMIVRPEKDGVLLSAVAGPLRDGRGQAGDISVRLDEVAYVRVTQPTDASCLPGWYPDPLPPLRPDLELRAGQNQPIWLTFHVSRATPPGDYRGEMEVKTSLGLVRVPLAVHVFDFALPEETHLNSALGLGTHAINRYHHLTQRGDQELVFEKYLQNFAEHRISPYSFYDYAPFEVRFAGEGTNKHAQLDFSRFDRAAAKWLDAFRFSTFQLPLKGMGGGTFHSRHSGRLEGFEEGTPQHARLFADYLGQVERHLRERGWLNKAFTYWFDEPDPKDYAFVVAGMERIRAAAPGIRRMLTEQPEKELMGHVDIWCGLTPEWTPETIRARREQGERVWWYICTGPKAPYVTEFIDHPGTELRLWPWQSWQYGAEGILIWATVYWTSPAAFPSPQLQDPWVDPMSYVSGYDFGPGHVGRWGNGDGRFLYPPRRAPGASREPILDDPVNSVRWENLRDGMEDYEYFWLLRQGIERARAGHVEAEVLAQATALLTVPASVSKDLTHFTTDPRPMLEHRERVARMIERLDRASR